MNNKDHQVGYLTTTLHTRPLAEDDNEDDIHHDDGNHDDDELLSCFKQFSVPDGVPDIVLPELYVQSTNLGRGRKWGGSSKGGACDTAGIVMSSIMCGAQGPHGANGGK